MDEEQKKELDKLKKEMQMMFILSAMIQNAPKDNQGNMVVDIAGVNGLPMFYLFKN